ncbi:F390 synthetase-related protein [Paenibacillus sp. HB172176]|uniref:F390 synthetase-related protein n=1 Tax=Paenibacillus sp. HB172176 TaxID=2493690 RepID=UPI00143C815E|nr:F390 synthetase-related protein [Paenibacillus sp. HB172176]
MRKLGHAVALLAQYCRIRLGRRWTKREAFERWQEWQVLRRLRKVEAQSAYYRELWEGRPLTEWRHFPIIDKTAMMDNFDALNTAGIHKETAMELALKAEKSRHFDSRISNVSIGLSSGTSGSRGLFLVSDRERAAWAGAVLAKLLPGPLWRAEKIAFFLRSNSELYQTVRRKRLQFEYFDLLQDIELHIERLNKYRPGILAAPPSVLRLLADARTEGRLTARPHRIISIAETLDPLDARVIQEAFLIPIHQAYQCTEGFLASTCRFGTLHLNEDIVHIGKEYVDEDSSGRRFVPIVTDFSRSTQPIIRYRLNDLLSEAEEACPCGSVFTAIERIEGRCDDIFYMEKLADGALMPVFPDFIARAIIAAAPDIEEYRAIQHGANRLEIELQVAAEGDWERAKSQVAARIAELAGNIGCRIPSMMFSAYTFKPGIHKLRRIERRWSI